MDLQTLENEVLAWRKRFPQHEYRAQDDCVELRQAHARPLFQHAEAEEAEALRPLVLKFAGAVNLDKSWCKDNEPTINILRACLNKYMDAMALIRQGVRAVER